jgi:hypothetical protein
MQRTVARARVMMGALALLTQCANRSAVGGGIYTYDSSVTVTMIAIPPGCGAAAIAGPTSANSGGFGINFEPLPLGVSIPGAGPSIFTDVSGNGFAGGPPPPSFSFSDAFAGGEIQLNNATRAAAIFFYQVSWSWSILAQVTPPGGFAIAHISWSVELDNNVVVAQAPAPVVSAMPGPPAIDNNANAVNFATPPLLPGIHTLTIDPSGYGAAATPEPSSFVLMGLGLACLVSYAGRRRSVPGVGGQRSAAPTVAAGPQ